jgi:peptidyl-prolyl cis-trans isomerase SurA
VLRAAAISILLLIPGFAAMAQDALQSAGKGLATSESPTRTGAVMIDGIAARIEGDIITESELRDLADFQVLVNGKAQSREDLLNEMLNQWVVQHEAQGTNYPKPAEGSGAKALSDLVARFPSQAAFEARLQELGLDDAAVRRQLELQEFLEGFLEYRFRAGVDVTDQDVQAYYDTEFKHELELQKQPVPPLGSVTDKIRELLAERQVSKRADEWINQTRSHLRIDVVGGNGCVAQPGSC